MLATVVRDPVLLITLLALVLLLLPMFASSAKMALSLTLASFVFTATLWGTPAAGALDFRPVAVLGLLFHGVQLGRAPARRYAMSSSAKLLVWTMVGFGTYSLTTMAWSIDPAKTLQSTAAWFLLIALVVVFPRLISGVDIARMVQSFLIAILSVSAVLALVRYPDAWSGERVRGIILNPNGLGIFCMFASPFFLLSPRRAMKVAWLVPVILCVFAGSRAAAAGLLVGAATIMWRSPVRRLRLLAFGALAAAVYTISLSPSSFLLSGDSSIVLLRDNNSREQVWQDALAAHTAQPWFGVGMGALPTESGSSYLKVLSECGYIGLALAAVTLVAVLRLVWPSPLACSFLVAGIVDAAFEGWLFTAGSVYAVFFFLIAFSSVAQGADDSPLEPVRGFTPGKNSSWRISADSTPVTLGPIRD